MYLFKVSTKFKTGSFRPSRPAAKPVYLVASDKAAAERLASERLASHLEVRSVSKLARQLAPHIFSGDV